jgi:hypothetical protein
VIKDEIGGINGNCDVRGLFTHELPPSRVVEWSNLDLGQRSRDNRPMEIPGHIQNGVVVLDSPMALPEGASVSVIVRAMPVIRVAKNQKPVEFPLVPSSNPGSVLLTNEMIGEILDRDDASS